jgi:two-component system, OmpR family, sensor kinase
MTHSEQALGLVLVCDLHGTVIKVIRDELELSEGPVLGQLLVRLVDRESIEKTLNFLLTLKTQGACFDWEINLRVRDKIMPIHFGGVAIDGQLLIIGSRTRNGVLELYEDFLRIHNEQVNALRTSTKDRITSALVHGERDSGLYDELSRLNNELVNLQRELAKKNLEFVQLNELKNQFLGMAAHDLRTPLGHVMSFSEFLLDELAKVLTEEQLEFLTTIHSSSEFMLALVNDLLDISRIESGRLELDLQPTDLTALIAHNTLLNAVLAAKKAIKIRFLPGGDLPSVMVDPERIEQVLSNLIGNAIKFSSPGGAIEVQLEQDGDRQVISVKDEGGGMSEEECAGLFSALGHRGKRGTGGEKSTGIGLAIVKRIITEHKGDIRVESRPGKGTTFHISLPMGT